MIKTIRVKPGDNLARKMLLARLWSRVPFLKGVEVRLAPGNYRLTKPLMGRAGIRISGAAHNKPVIQLGGDPRIKGVK